MDMWDFKKQYAIGQTIGARVCGTGNLSERTVGYSTKWGDGACDFNPLGNLTSLEVIELGKALGLSGRVLKKAPADGLSGSTDEEKLGITYQAIHNYIRGIDIAEDDRDKIEKKKKYGMHKIEPIPMFSW